jgi:hypothetical protein
MGVSICNDADKENAEIAANTAKESSKEGPARTHHVRNSQDRKGPPQSRNVVLSQHPISGYISAPQFFLEEDWIGQQEHIFTMILNDTLSEHAVQSKCWDSKTETETRVFAFGYFQSEKFQIIRRRLSTVNVASALC